MIFRSALSGRGRSAGIFPYDGRVAGHGSTGGWPFRSLTCWSETGSCLSSSCPLRLLSLRLSPVRGADPGLLQPHLARDPVRTAGFIVDISLGGGHVLLALCLFLAAASSQQGWDTTNPNTGTKNSSLPHPRSALTFGIHSLIGIFCGQASSQIPQAMHSPAR